MAAVSAAAAAAMALAHSTQLPNFGGLPVPSSPAPPPPSLPSTPTTTTSAALPTTLNKTDAANALAALTKASLLLTGNTGVGSTGVGNTGAKQEKKSPAKNPFTLSKRASCASGASSAAPAQPNQPKVYIVGETQVHIRRDALPPRFTKTKKATSSSTAKSPPVKTQAEKAPPTESNKKRARQSPLKVQGAVNRGPSPRIGESKGEGKLNFEKSPLKLKVTKSPLPKAHPASPEKKRSNTPAGSPRKPKEASKSKARKVSSDEEDDYDDDDYDDDYDDDDEEDRKSVV